MKKSPFSLNGDNERASETINSRGADSFACAAAPIVWAAFVRRKLSKSRPTDPATIGEQVF
jgi:hypothetical protein